MSYYKSLALGAALCEEQMPMALDLVEVLPFSGLHPAAAPALRDGSDLAE